MMERQVLFVGGSGVVGRQAVKLFRARQPDVPILIGGRNLERARAVALELGTADAVKIDIDKPRLGLRDDLGVAAVVMLAPDDGLNGLTLAQDLGIPYLSIGNWLVEVGAELAHFIARPNASPVVLSSHWHGGPTVFLALASVHNLDVVHSIRVGAIVDEDDSTGPTAIEDMERAGQGVSGVLSFKGGKRVWLTGDLAERTIETIDGRLMQGRAFAPYDIASLQALTGAAEVRFDLAMGVSSSRLCGGPVATELILDIDGEINGRLVTRRSTIEFTQGQAKLTGLSVALSLSTVLGLEGRAAVPTGLYFPESFMDPGWFLEQLRQAGATVTIGSDQDEELIKQLSLLHDS